MADEQNWLDKIKEYLSSSKEAAPSTDSDQSLMDRYNKFIGAPAEAQDMSAPQPQPSKVSPMDPQMADPQWHAPMHLPTDDNSAFNNVDPDKMAQDNLNQSFDKFTGDERPKTDWQPPGIFGMSPHGDYTLVGGTPPPTKEEMGTMSPLEQMASSGQVPMDVSSSSKTSTVKKPGMGSLGNANGTLPGMAAPVDSTAALKAAQDAQNSNLSNALLMRAGAQIGAGLSHTKADYGFSDELAKQAGIPVEQYKEQETAKAQDLKLRQAKQQFEDEKFRKDPNSTLNQMMRGVFQKMGMNVPPNATIDGMKEILPGIDTYFKAEMLKDSRAESSKAKATQDEAKAYSEMRNKLETFRGNKAAQQAAADVYSAGKALRIVQGKDPNTLTTQDLALLAPEIMKIASGGIPSEHGVKALMPNNLQTKAAEFQNFLLSKPTDAQAGEYIKRNMQYLKGMVEESDKVLNDFRHNISQGYKGRVNKEHMDETYQDYPGISGQTTQSSGAAPSASPVPDLDKKYF